MSLVTLYYLIFAGIFGAIIGSFLNVLSLRSLKLEKLTGRSYCPNCKHRLGVWDLLPIVSFFLLKGKCRYCHQKISIQYPLIEIATALLYILTVLIIFQNFQGRINVQVIFTTVIYLFGLSVLLAIFVTDFKAGLIPNRIIIPASLLLLTLKILYLLVFIVVTYLTLAQDSVGIGKYLLPPYSNYLFVIIGRTGMPIFYDLLVGLGIGLAFYMLVLFTRGRAMGGGDIKLGFFIGLLNGWPLALVTLMIAFTLGALYSIVLLLVGKKRFGQTVAFGPFLVVGSILTLFWGQGLFNWYINLMR